MPLNMGEKFYFPIFTSLASFLQLMWGNREINLPAVASQMTDPEFHRQLLDNLSTAVLVIDSDLRVCFISPSAQALLELSESRSLGTELQELLPGQPQLLDSLAGAEQSPFTNRGLNLRLASGHELIVDCSVTPYPVGESNGLQLILELHPVDRIMRINREEGIISSQQNTQALIRGLAHEIKNPLGGLRGAAQLLARELPDPALEEYTRVIIAESDRLRDLVDRMLGSQRQPQFAQINVHEIIEHVRTLLTAEAGSKVKFVRDYDPSLPDLRGDRSQLIQAVINIARNAMQATQDNEDERIITLRTRVQRQFTIGAHRYRLVCRVDIGDNGSGIPPDMLYSIFIPMVSGRADGTGLGLAISQSIINQHRGLIECNSEPGCTVFTLFIPLEENNA
jgi:two-component system nitrogen regulation sensor histidine kinase GlnL